MRFLIDAQLPPDLAETLRQRGLDAVHVADLDLLAASDGVIWETAIASERVLVSKDRDFADWAAVRTPAPVVVWIRTGNLSRTEQAEHLDKNWLRIQTRLVEGARLVEVR